MKKRFFLLPILIFLLGLPPSYARPKRASHVFIIIMENESYRNILNSPDAPFFNRLSGGLLTNYWGVAHPSLPNYVAMMGAWPPLPLSDDPRIRIGGDSLPEEMVRHGHSVKAYMQGLPHNGFGGKGYPPVLQRYVLKHDPFLLFTRVRQNKALRLEVQPLYHLAGDLENDRVPELSLIVPDLCNDMHGSYTCHIPNGHELIHRGDAFLAKWIPALLRSKTYQIGSSWIFILWDEGNTNVPFLTRRALREIPPSNGRLSTGGHIPFLWISGLRPSSWRSDCFANHYSLLETLTRNFALPELAPPGERIPLPTRGKPCLP
jgi:hypothetical protein